MERVRKIKGTLIVVTAISLLTGTNSVTAKSVYAITDHDVSTLKAYKIQGNQLQEQANIFATNYDAGGITIDSNLGLLFITYEGSTKIVWVNAKTLEQEGFVDLYDWYPYAGELAGIVADEAKQRVYVMERDRDKLYILAWNSNQKKLILMDPQNPNQPYSSGNPYVTLTGLQTYGGWGIALDENTRRLYVANNTTNVHIYDANNINWTHLGTRDVGREAMGIAVNPNNGQHPAYLYIGGFQAPEGGFHTFLVKHNLEAQTNPNTEQNIGAVVTGLAVDVDTGLVYVTTTDWQVRVYNCSSYPFTCTDWVGTGGLSSGPAGICVPIGDVSYKPPLFYLVKVDVNEPNSVLPDYHITYEITYGPNGYADTNVVITDYLPGEVDYENFDPNYNSSKHTYTWQIGSIGANDPNKSVTLTVKVNEGAAPNGIITNYCEIESDTACTPATAVTNVGYWQPNSQIIYVDSLSPCTPGTGMSWRFAYRDLQDALERAAAGCGSEIWVAKGTYRPSERTNPGDPYSATFQLVEGVSIYGGFPSGGGLRNWITNETFLDGQNGVSHVVTANSIEDAALDGFTIKGSYGGYGAVSLDDANVTIINCKLKENSGSGIYIINHSHPYIHNCLFEDNSDCAISCEYSEPLITNSTFDGNNITSWAIYASGSDVTLADCIVKKHTYGITVFDSTLNLTNSVICFNGGCGISLQKIYSWIPSSATIKNNWIYNNSYGIYFIGLSVQPLVRNNTIVKNAAYGVYLYSGTSPDISNCIIWDNAVGQLYGCTASYSCVQDGGTNNHNIDTPPCFFDADANNFHLSPAGSPCIDKGDPNGNYDGETDIDGENRKVDGDSNGTEIVDMGADEFYWIVNFIDYAIFAQAWNSNAGGPKWNPDCDLDANGIIDYYDLDLFCEDWLTQAGWARSFSCGVGEGMSQTMAAALAPTVGAAGEVSSQSISAERQIEKVEPVKIEQMIKWLEEIWLDPEARKFIDEDTWLKFIESLKEEL